MKITKEIINTIKEHARRDLPNEACGYVAGNNSSLSVIYPLTNMDQSPEHFSFEPKEQFQVLKKAREEGLQLKAIYHSHPETPARMSEEDKRLAHDPGMIYLIYSVSDDQLKAFGLNEEKEVIDILLEEPN